MKGKKEIVCVRIMIIKEEEGKQMRECF